MLVFSCGPFSPLLRAQGTLLGSQGSERGVAAATFLPQTKHRDRVQASFTSQGELHPNTPSLPLILASDSAIYPTAQAGHHHHLVPLCSGTHASTLHPLLLSLVALLLQHSHSKSSG